MARLTKRNSRNGGGCSKIRTNTADQIAFAIVCSAVVNVPSRTASVMTCQPIRPSTGNASKSQYDSADNCPVIMAIPIATMTMPAP